MQPEQRVQTGRLESGEVAVAWIDRTNAADKDMNGTMRRILERAPHADIWIGELRPAAAETDRPREMPLVHRRQVDVVDLERLLGADHLVAEAQHVLERSS